MRRTTFQNVAKSLNLSVQTIYRVIHNNSNVRNETREKVLTALDQHGYLIKKNRDTLKIVFNLDDSAFTNKIAIPLMKSLAGPSFSCQVVHYEENPRQFEESVADAGFVIWGTYPTADILARAKSLNPDCVHVNLLGGGIGGDLSFDADDIHGGRIAARHLHEHGHRRVLLATAMDRFQNHADRANSFLTELRRLNPDAQIRIARQAGAQAAAEVCRKALDKGLQGATAIFCTHGNMTATMLDELSRRNLSVPGDVSLLGYDHPRDSGLLGRQPIDHIHGDFKVLTSWVEFFIRNRPPMESLRRLRSTITPELEPCGSVTPPR